MNIQAANRNPFHGVVEKFRSNFINRPSYLGTYLGTYFRMLLGTYFRMLLGTYFRVLLERSRASK